MITLPKNQRINNFKKQCMLKEFLKHGFFKGCSISTNLTEFTNFAASNIESGLQLDVIVH